MELSTSVVTQTLGRLLCAHRRGRENRMLALARSRHSLRLGQYVRPLCSDKSLEEGIAKVEAQLAQIKAKLSGQDAPLYSVEELEKDAANGTVDISKISAMFGAENSDGKKDMIAKATKVNELAKTINNFKEPTFDWDDWSAKFESLGDPNYVPAFKQYVEKTMQAVKEASMKQVEEEVAKGHAELKAIFEGPDGELEKAKKADAESAVAMSKAVESLEQQLHDLKRIEEITIAEILEKNPEFRAAAEEDIKNHNWGGEIPAAYHEKYKSMTAEAQAQEAGVALPSSSK